MTATVVQPLTPAAEGSRPLSGQRPERDCKATGTTSAAVQAIRVNKEQEDAEEAARLAEEAAKARKGAKKGPKSGPPSSSGSRPASAAKSEPAHNPEC